VAVLDFKSVGERASLQRLQPIANTVPIGIATPLRLGTQSDGILAMHFSMADQIADNLRNLLLTNHGERLGLYDFGANLRELSMEHGHDAFDAEAITRIKVAVDKYMSFISLQTFESKSTASLGGVTERVDIKIVYDVPRLNLRGQELVVTIFVRG
jgi:phage baseplate assembly protein W